MARGISLVSRLPEFLAALSLFSLMCMTFADVVLRSLLNAPVEVAADMTRLLMAIMVFSVLPVMSARGAHISVDLAEQIFRRFALVRIRNIVVNLFCGIILIWPASRILDLAERSRSYGDKMEYLGLPLHYIGWFIALMTGLTALSLIVRGVIEAVRPAVLEADR